VSFSFTAIGSQAEVVRQLRHVAPAHDVTGFNKAGREVALLIARHLEDYQGEYKYGYVVKASGHSSTSGMPLSLNVTVEPVWMPDLPAEDVTAGEPETGTGVRVGHTCNDDCPGTGEPETALD